jgi:hypothetical protein
MTNSSHLNAMSNVQRRISNAEVVRNSILDIGRWTFNPLIRAMLIILGITDKQFPLNAMSNVQRRISNAEVVLLRYWTLGVGRWTFNPLIGPCSSFLGITGKPFPIECNVQCPTPNIERRSCAHFDIGPHRQRIPVKDVIHSPRYITRTLLP